MSLACQGPSSDQVSNSCSQLLVLNPQSGCPTPHSICSPFSGDQVTGFWTQQVLPPGDVTGQVRSHQREGSPTKTGFSRAPQVNWFWDIGLLPVRIEKLHPFGFSSKRWELIQKVQTDPFGCTYWGLTLSLHLKSLPGNPVGRGRANIRRAPGASGGCGSSLWRGPS